MNNRMKYAVRQIVPRPSEKELSEIFKSAPLKESSMADTKKQWVYGSDEEHFCSEKVDSKEEAIELLREEQDGDGGYVGRVKDLDFKSVIANTISLDTIEERIQVQLYEEVGEAADGWRLKYDPVTAREVEERIAEVVYNYATENNSLPRCYKVVDIEVIPQEGQGIF